MDVHLFRLTSPSPRATRIFKGSNQLVLLGVHRNHRVAPPPESLRQPVDIAKLAIAIPMLGSLFALDIELQPIVELFQQPGYGIGLNRMSPTSQCRGVRVDLLVQRNRFIGSPAVLSSTRPVNSRPSWGSTSSVFLRPPPGWRAPPPGGSRNSLSLCNSPIALVIVVRDIPVKADR